MSVTLPLLAIAGLRGCRSVAYHATTLHRSHH
ncbi:hypothetical protein M3J09_004949 [Ascochyta lentis]